MHTEKRCTKCAEIKALTEFHKDAKNRDGHESKCKQCHSEYGKKYYQDNYNEINILAGEYREKNREKERKRISKWHKDNPEYRRKYDAEKRKTDPAFRINNNMSRGIHYALKGEKNGMHWETFVDYNLKELMIHLESKFTEGMNWDNYGKGGWVIDHIIAKSKFNITSAECQEFRDCWALNNLQPLWGIRNAEKGDKPMEPKYLIKPEGLILK